MQRVKQQGTGGSEDKVPGCSAGDPGSIPELGRSPGEGNGNPIQYSCLENPKDGGAWQATVHGVAKSLTRLSDFTFTFLLAGFPGGSISKESACNTRDLGVIPGSGSFLGEGNGNPIQYSCLGNPMDIGVWWATVYGVTKELDMTS